MAFGTSERDDSLRRVSRATRGLIAASVGLVVVFSGYVALAIPAKKSTTTVSTPAAATAPLTLPPTIPPTLAPSSGGTRTVPTPLPTVAPPPQPYQVPVRPHTQSRGS